MAHYEQDDSGQWWYYRSSGRVKAETRSCEYCSTQFQTVKSTPIKYCSRLCAQIHTKRILTGAPDPKEPIDQSFYKRDKKGQLWYYCNDHRGVRRRKSEDRACSTCGKTFFAICKTSAQFCSRECQARAVSPRGENHPRWNGGRTKTSDGYVLILMPDHPAAKAIKDFNYVREHRLVMEEYLGRYLHPYEEVHHINGIKDDNRIENLELWTKHHPAGVRVVDIPEQPLDHEAEIAWLKNENRKLTEKLASLSGE